MLETLILALVLASAIGLPILAARALGRIGRLEQEVARLRRELRDLRRGLEPAPGPAAPTPQVSAPPPQPEPHLSLQPDEPNPPAVPEPIPVPAAIAHPAAARRPTTQTPWIELAKTWLIGGNLVARLGVLVLFFGVAFALAYAAEQGWLPIELRLAGAAAGGLGLVALGWRLLGRRRPYALVLQGGGVGIVYLSVFAAIDTYQLVASGPGLALMVTLVALTATLAVRQDARSLALLALIGGFLAPVLISRGGSHVALFGYYLALNLGVLGIAWRKAWRELNLAGFLFTFVIGGLWGWQFYQPAYFATTQPFLVLFFLLYLVIPVLFALRQPPDLRGYVDGSLVFGVPLVAFGLQSALVRDFAYGAAVSAAVIALIYALVASLIARRSAARLGTLAEAFLGLGLAFGTLAIPLAVDGRWTGSAWALEGAALVWLGLRQRRVLARIAGLLVQLAAGVALATTLGAPTAEAPILNGVYLSALMLALAGLFSAWQLHRHRAELTEHEVLLGPLVLAWGLLWWFGAGGNEIARHVPARDQLPALMTFASLSAAALGYLRGRLAWPALAWPGLLLLVLMLIAALDLVDAGLAVRAFEGWGLAAWTLAFAVQYWLLHRLEGDWPRNLLALWHATTLWLAIFLLAWESHWALRVHFALAPAWVYPAWVAAPLAAVALYPFLERRLAWPLPRLAWAYRGLALPPLVAVLGLWVLWVSLERGDPTPLTYLPILNPIELGQLLALGVMLRWALAEARQPAWVWYALAAIAFIALNGLIGRAIHFYADVPFTLAALWASAQLQAGLSIAWALLALAVMAGGTRQRLRPAWIAGAALLTAVVAKLFLVDLAGAGTVARIVSFLGVGLLILVIGYLAPLPPQVRPVSPQAAARPGP